MKKTFGGDLSRLSSVETGKKYEKAFNEYVFYSDERRFDYRVRKMKTKTKTKNQQTQKE